MGLRAVMTTFSFPWYLWPLIFVLYLLPMLMQFFTYVHHARARVSCPNRRRCTSKLMPRCCCCCCCAGLQVLPADHVSRKVLLSHPRRFAPGVRPAAAVAYRTSRRGRQRARLWAPLPPPLLQVRRVLYPVYGVLAVALICVTIGLSFWLAANSETDSDGNFTAFDQNMTIYAIILFSLLELGTRCIGRGPRVCRPVTAASREMQRLSSTATRSIGCYEDSPCRIDASSWSAALSRSHSCTRASSSFASSGTYRISGTGTHCRQA